ncbi:Uncharacterised protein [Mycobacteroides abscessus subsp. abscessus]|nr:Uncharacterised protein [Mycobacteroides abscessus subsp. abscessus]
MEPDGPAGVTRSTAPSSRATCAARATSGLVTDARANCWVTGPIWALMPSGATTAAATVDTGQSATRSRAPMPGTVASCACLKLCAV